jgi:hypothetical protein
MEKNVRPGRFELDPSTHGITGHESVPSCLSYCRPHATRFCSRPISYTRDKDTYDEVVSHFRDRLENELRIRDKQSIVFQDTRMISPGAKFSDIITVNLADSDVLVVLFSPAWLKSEYCRGEFEAFVNKEASQGRTPRILPLIWVGDPPAKISPDSIEREVSLRNYLDWRDLRKRDWKSKSPFKLLKDEVDKVATSLCDLART